MSSAFDLLFSMDFFIVLIPAFVLGLAYFLAKDLPINGFVGSIILLIGAIFLRWMFYPYISDDYERFISEWLTRFSAEGFGAIAETIGDYTPPYQYILAAISSFGDHWLALVKSVSIFFDMLLAIGCCELAFFLNPRKTSSMACFFVVLLLPTVFLNSSCWAQCDSIYIAFLVWSLYLFLSGRHTVGAVFAGVAFSFKLQAIFLLPIFIPLLFAKKAKVWDVLVFLAAFVVMNIPAIAVGKPIGDIISVYVGQVGEYSSYLTLNAYNFFFLVPDGLSVDYLFKLGIGIAAGCCVLFFLISWVSRKSGDTALVLLAFCFAMALPYFLPAMHERYFYLAVVLAAVLAFANHSSFIVLVLSEVGSFSGYYAYLKGEYLFTPKISALLFLAALVVALFLLGLEIKNSKKAKIVADKA